MNTETTENTRGWLFYDATCPVCLRWVERGRGLLLKRGFHLVPLQAPWVGPRIGLDQRELMFEMKLLTRDDEIVGGADAFIYVARYIWWARLFFVVAQFPGMKSLLRAIYRWVARNRHCLPGRCDLPTTTPHNQNHGARSFYELP